MTTPDSSPANESSRSSVRCERCGSSRLRRAHTPLGWGRLLRRFTPFRRYACGSCGYHGWTPARLGSTPPPENPSPVATGRPVESRDRRRINARRRRALRGVLFAVALGAVACWYILRNAS
jgi:hypothetical protein